jgi:hypothetical protein
MKNKRGFTKNKIAQQLFGMPFSIIFSIIIIVVILIVAFYVINHFLDFKRCADSGLFLNDLEREVKEAYESSFSDKTFSGVLPSSVKQVCIGDIPEEPSSSEDEMITELRRWASMDSNVFLYPPQKICAEGRSKHIDYLEKGEFKCFDVNDGKIEIRIKRDYTGKVQLLKQ